ncbi:apolipoprotein N-acyltransferase [Rhodococcus sp. PAMC28707]|uniref:apolipoprotein N-acyltransferase n=1 Tax=unclassified Rhodococcus (in: high G+C Gram-positive bacteria) TaxID=192944 RepID=UPI00109E05D9|nr:MULTISPECIES: apolipoprotein N-acyltransferase [unclassified Rhodococcus (in: high G+C Gram-positive bacteria)]QCB51169.1 apolipoprotein N-acyltransferase [Rhodococcus sp. PAMC28705]QCB57140.1 apolipoprotein N-acyltransferase [Rhodococcus sp. PAMC28707]
MALEGLGVARAQVVRSGVSVLSAVASGLLLFLSFPPRPLWFLAPVGVALLVLVLRRFGTTGSVSKKSGFGYGFLAGLGFFVPLLPWIGVYVGPLPWLALAAAESLFIGLFGVLAVVVSRNRWWPVSTAAVWSLVEWARSSFPFGGFPWGRLSFGQPDSWLLPLASIGGAPLLSFGVALTGTGLAAIACTLAARKRRPIRGMLIVSVATTSAASIVAVALLPTLVSNEPEAGERTITVAAIQGSVPRLGLDFNSQRRAVLDNHVRETFALADEVSAGRADRPDLVVWPENASDIDPLRNADATSEITAASVAVGAPILVGTVLVNDDRTTTNSVIAWNGIEGPGERHDKKIIQPFGEYLPYRSFFRMFSEYADKAGYFVPGTGNGVVHAAGIAAGIATCYEVAFDRALTESVRSGAEFIAIPTNNATFGDTEMTYQQLAMSRIRAVEHGRSVVVAATSGVSAIVSPDGSVVEQTPLFVPDTLVAQIGLHSRTTVATDLGAWPERLLCISAALFLLLAVVRPRTTGNESVIDQRNISEVRK